MSTHRGYISVPADTRRFHWQSPRSRGSFSPNGALTVVGRDDDFRENPAAWSSRAPIYSARIFVGFNVGQRPKWKMDDVVRIVKRIRREQVDKPDATFLYQRGLYTSEKDGSLVDEKGAQIIILNLAGAAPRVFRKQMLDLAEAIAEELRQESVIVEIQRGGISKETVGVAPLRRTG